MNHKQFIIQANSKRVLLNNNKSTSLSSNECIFTNNEDFKQFQLIFNGIFIMF